MEQSASTQEVRPYQNLKGRELVEWALEVGEEVCLELVPRDSTPRRYLEAVSRRAEKEFPPEFFASTVEELWEAR